MTMTPTRAVQQTRRTPSPQSKSDISDFDHDSCQSRENPTLLGEGRGEGAPDSQSAVRHDWTRAEVRALFELPFPDLMFQAQTVHRTHFDPREVQISTLLSIKTGGCPEDCAYCPQSAHYQAGVKAEKLMDVAAVLD